MYRNLSRLIAISMIIFIVTATAVSEVTIAVVPFNAGENLIYKEYYRNEFPVFLSDGLSKYKTIKVIDRMNIQKVMDELHLSQTGLIDMNNAPEIGQMLSANTILTGNVSRIGLHTNITVQAIDVATGSIYFSETEKRIIKSHRNLFEVQQSLLKKVVSHYVPDGEIEPQNIHVIYQDIKGYNRRLEDGDQFKLNTGFSIYLKPSEVIYLYAFLIDGAGETIQLFPEPEISTQNNPLQAEESCWLPAENEQYHLNANKGKEYIYIFATPFQINDFEKSNSILLRSEQQTDLSSTSLNRKVYDINELVQGIEKRGGFVHQQWFIIE